MVGQAHPNIYTCIQALQSIESTQRNALLRAAAGALQRRKQKRWIIKDAKIQDLEERLTAGTIDLDGFMEEAQMLCGL